MRSMYSTDIYTKIENFFFLKQNLSMFKYILFAFWEGRFVLYHALAIVFRSNWVIKLTELSVHFGKLRHHRQKIMFLL